MEPAGCGLWRGNGCFWESSGGDSSEPARMAAQLFHPPRCSHCQKTVGARSSQHTVPSWSDLGLGDFDLVCVYILLPINRAILVNRKESRVLSHQTKLSFIAPTLIYPHWKNVSALNLVLWHGYSKTPKSRKSLCLEDMLYFLKLTFWNSKSAFN